MKGIEPCAMHKGEPYIWDPEEVRFRTSGSRMLQGVGDFSFFSRAFGGGLYWLRQFY